MPLMLTLTWLPPAQAIEFALTAVRNAINLYQTSLAEDESLLKAHSVGVCCEP